MYRGLEALDKKVLVTNFLTHRQTAPNLPFRCLDYILFFIYMHQVNKSISLFPTPHRSHSRSFNFGTDFITSDHSLPKYIAQDEEISNFGEGRTDKAFLGRVQKGCQLSHVVRGAGADNKSFMQI